MFVALEDEAVFAREAVLERLDRVVLELHDLVAGLADQVVALAEGRIVEKGTYAELSSRTGSTLAMLIVGEQSGL